jgi:HEPN domain-containing protein
MSEETKKPMNANTEVSVDILDQEEEYKEWLTFARTDFESAKYLDGAPFHPRSLNVRCYHCQQAAEKAVKALIVYFGSQGGMPKVHDISFLLNQIKNIVLEQKGITIEHDLLITANSLSKYGVAPRYPNEIEVDEYQVKKALADSETILKWVDGVIAANRINEDTE